MDEVVALPVDALPDAGSLLTRNELRLNEFSLNESKTDEFRQTDFFHDGDWAAEFGEKVSDESLRLWIAEEHDEVGTSASISERPVSARDQIRDALEAAGTAQTEANRAQAAQVAALALAVDLAEANPRVYMTEFGMAQPDFVEMATRGVVGDAALRLNISPDQVRNQAYHAHVLAESLPQLWELFRSGATGYTQARAAAELLHGITDPAAISQYDTELTAVAPDISPAAFRKKARTLAHRLLPEPAELRHTRALADRKVIIEPAEDGMAWLHAYMSAADAIRIKALYDATAKRESKNAKATAKKAGVACTDNRTLDHHRVDLVVGWLAGDGTPTAAKVRPLVFIPILGLLGLNNPDDQSGQTGQSDQLDQPIPDPDPDPDHPEYARAADHLRPPDHIDHTRRRSQPAILQGYGPIDPVTAAQLFLDAPSFRRVATDPFTGEILSFDRTRYRPTQAQREWIALKYDTCGTPGCDCLAATSDIDHLAEWARDNGLTNENNLIPLCPRDHRLKTLTKVRYERDTEGSITVTTPTGYVRRNTPSAPLPENPPF